jgi:hypothetical protein
MLPFLLRQSKLVSAPSKFVVTICSPAIRVNGIGDFLQNL